MSDALGMEISYCRGWWGVPIPFVLQRLVPTCLPVCMQNVRQVWAVLCYGVKRSPGFALLHHFRFSLSLRCLLPRHSGLCWSCERVCFYTVEHDISTYMHIPTKKEGSRRGGVHTQTHSQASERLWESQNAEPEGCCASDVCIVYSVVPAHVGDCCTLMPQSSLVLLTLTAVDSRLLSRRAAKGGRGDGGGRQRSKEKEERIIEYTFPPYICSHTTFFSFWALL